MLTRRQAKLQRLLVEEQPPQVAPIGVLSDLFLELVFSFLDTTTLVQAAQVCTRWRDLCSTRRLWCSRTLHHANSEVESLRVVRLLRRTQGVVRYREVCVSTSAYYTQGSAFFSDDASTLTIKTSSSLMALLCLRHLVKDHVETLALVEPTCKIFTAFEALAVWETVASKKSLTKLNIYFCINSALHGVTFDWPERGSLTELTLAVPRDVRFGGRLCRPIRSLLEVHRRQLTRLDILAEDQQALLNFAPANLLILSAVLVPSLVKVLKPMKHLSSLFLRSHDDHGDESCQVLKQLLTSGNIQPRLRQLNISLKSGICSVAESVALLALIRAFDFLAYVCLRGVCCALSDPDRGPSALKDLASLPRMLTLEVDVEPSTFPLHALLPRSTDGGNSEPLVRLPATLNLLILGDAQVSQKLCDFEWLQQLSRVMVDYPRLHVRVQGKCLEVESSGGVTKKERPSNVAILPHPAYHRCQDCAERLATKGDRRVYIGYLCRMA